MTLNSTYFKTASALALVGGVIFEVGSWLMVVEALNRRVCLSSPSHPSELTGGSLVIQGPGDRIRCGGSTSSAIRSSHTRYESRSAAEARSIKRYREGSYRHDRVEIGTKEIRLVLCKSLGVIEDRGFESISLM